MSHPLCSFESVSFAYGANLAVENLNFELDAGCFVGIVGPSGSGKTTALRLLLGTEKPKSGTITRSKSLRLGYVPQVETVDWNFPVTVAEVVGMTRTSLRWWPKTSDIESREISDVLERLGLAGLENRHIRELSGGQQQRVFIARSLFHRPNLLVLDEPTSGVDVATRHEVFHLLVELQKTGMGIVLTTHDLNGLAAHLPRIICLNKSVIADGSPSEVITPAVLEQTYGAPMRVLVHGGMPVVLDLITGEHAEHFEGGAQ